MDKSSNGRGAEGRYKRPNFPMEFKRQLAEQSFEPGTSVALIARQNDVNANLLFMLALQAKLSAPRPYCQVVATLREFLPVGES